MDANETHAVVKQLLMNEDPVIQLNTEAVSGLHRDDSERGTLRDSGKEFAKKNEESSASLEEQGSNKAGIEQPKSSAQIGSVEVPQQTSSALTQMESGNAEK